ncbi:MAG TPA: type II toxin-antitoxin system VapC family toxin [Rhizomicrobium sp.]
MILVDTSVLLDVLTNDSVWADWSQSALERASAEGNLAINDIVYSELSIRFETVEALDSAVAPMGLNHAAVPRAALFLAGKAFLRYCQQGGTRTGVLSDFFIGAHAAVSSCPLITRDTRRIAHYFPGVTLIAPA